MLDLLLKRPRYERALLTLNETTQSVCSVSVGIAYYSAKKNGVTNTLFFDFIADFEILSVGSETINQAMKLAGSVSDLDDAIQITACKHAGIDTFVTADRELAELYCDELNIELVE